MVLAVCLVFVLFLTDSLAEADQVKTLCELQETTNKGLDAFMQSAQNTYLPECKLLNEAGKEV